MEVALYFGSFNPIHNGHIGLAKYLIANTNVDELWFVVSPQNPLKKRADLWPDDLRFELAQLAVSGEERLKVCDVEFHLPIPSYTINTLKFLSHKHSYCHFSLLMGADNYHIFDKWYCHDEILENYPIYVYPREGIKPDKLKFPQMHWLDAPLFPISSTMIRDRIKNNLNIDDLVPYSVKEKIMSIF